MLRARLGDKKYDSYYKFTFVRNPWARILSSYFWRQRLPKKRPVAPFPDFVENAKQAVRTGQYYRQEFGDHFIPQTEYTRDVDDVFRCENFENAVRTVAAKLGVFVGRVPAKTPKHHDKYREFYDGRTRAVIAELYREEIEELGYRFEEE